MMEAEEDPFRLKLLYFFLYGGLGVLSPYVPVFFERLHMTKSQIGILLMIPSMSSFVFAPLWSMFCDRLNIRSEVIFFALMTSQVLTCSMYFFEAFTSMVSIVVIGSVVKAPLTSLVDSLVIDSLTDKTRYGSMRLWGAISFAITSFLGGAILSTLETPGEPNVRPFSYVFGLHGIFGVLTGVIILSITMRSRRAKAISITNIEKLQIEEETISGDISVTNDCLTSYEEADAVKLSVTASVMNVLTSCPSVGIFFVVVFCTGLGSGVIDAFLFLRLKQLGGSGLVMGISRAITCAAEVPCFQIAGALQKRLGTWRLLALTQLAFVIRFTYYSLLTEPWAVLPCEVLHGFTYAIMWSTACTYADEIAPKHVHSTIQAIVDSIHWGLGSGLGALLGGYAYSSYGAVPLFRASALISVFSTLLAAAASVMYGPSRLRNTSIAFTVLSGVPTEPQEEEEEGALELECLDPETSMLKAEILSEDPETNATV